MVKEQIKGAQAQHAQTNNAHSHDGTARKGDFQGGADSMLCGGGSTNIGFCGYLHAEVTGHNRAKSAANEADRCLPTDEDCENCGYESNKNSKITVLAIQKRHGAFVDIAGDFLHASIAGLGAADACTEVESECKGQRSGEGG